MSEQRPRIPSSQRGLRLSLAIKRDPLSFFTRLMNEAGDYAWLAVNGRRIVMLNDATGIEHVLQHNSAAYYKGYFQRSMTPVFGQSILMQEGAGWKKRRQEAAPVFAHGNFRMIIPQMIMALETRFRSWDKQIAQGKAIDLSLEMTHFTLDAMLRSLFHETRENVATKMRLSLGLMLEDVETRLWSAFKLPVAIAHRLPRYKAARQFMEKLVDELITARKADKAYPEDLLSRFILGFQRLARGTEGSL